MSSGPHRAIFDAWSTLLATVRTANGFQTEIGKNVFEFRDTEKSPIGTGEVPCVNASYSYMRDDQGQGCADCLMTITCEAVPDISATPETDIQKAGEDIEKLVAGHRQNALWLNAEASQGAAFDLTVADKNYGGTEVKIQITYSIKTSA